MEAIRFQPLQAQLAIVQLCEVTRTFRCIQEGWHRAQAQTAGGLGIEEVAGLGAETLQDGNNVVPSPSSGASGNCICTIYLSKQGPSSGLIGWRASRIWKNYSIVWKMLCMLPWQ